MIEQINIIIKNISCREYFLICKITLSSYASEIKVRLGLSRHVTVIGEAIAAGSILV
jgi:hypothetical protein